MQEVIKPLALIADPISLRYKQVLDENRVGIHCAPAHLRDPLDLDFLSIQPGEKYRHSIGRLGTFRQRRGSGEQQDVIGFLRR